MTTDTRPDFGAASVTSKTAPSELSVPASVAAHTGPYEVTRDGRVLSLTGWRGERCRELAQDTNHDGYPSVRVVINGKRTRYPVYKLVARKYLPPRPSPAHEVRHLDGDRTNSRADNLTWGTRKENAADRERHGRTSRGERHSAAIKAGLAGAAS